MQNVDLKFEHVSKVYRITHQADAAHPASGLVSRVLGRGKRIEDFWAVRDVSFEVQRGEVVGIIGHNGAGKSTVLKLLSNITAPTAGEITIHGHLSALIEVGSGFHPELSGRENVFLSGSILGMRRAEIAAKLDSIVEFAELADFIDTPVKRYSSGMYVRLGFAIAAHLDPDILLLDEVLAVGDARFQAKCLDRIDELRRAGRTIVFISHDLSAVARLCSRVLLMSHGQVVASGTPTDVIAEYANASTMSSSSLTASAASKNCTGEASLTSVTVHKADGTETAVLRTGEPFTARIGYAAGRRITNAAFVLFLNSEDGDLACQLTAEGSDTNPLDIQPGSGIVEFSCAELGLRPGIYQIDLTIEQYPKIIDWRTRCATLRVDPGKLVRGRFHMPSSWRRLENRKEPAPTERGNTNVSRA